MMLCLALRSSPQQVYQRALRQFAVDEISEAFAAARGLALPSQLRRMMRAQGRDLAGEFVRLLPTPPRPIAVQRWSARRVGLLLLVLLALIPAVPIARAFAQISTNPGGASGVAGGIGSCSQIEELWLQAQSVPSASRIPCLRTFPVGNAGVLYVRNGESVLEVGHISVDSNINAGDQPQTQPGPGGMRIRLTAACDVGTVGEGRTVAPGIRRFQVQEPRGMPVVADVFLGGCVTYRPPPGMDASARLLDQAERAVVFRTHDELRQALRRRSNGRLELDPQGG
jgi:hypothetical protein